VAILFQPVRVYIQRIVDKWFFRIRYNFQVTEREIVETLKQKYTTQEAAHYVLTSLEAIFLPLKLGIFLKDEFENKYKLAVENNLKGDKVDTIINIFTALPKNSHNIFAADYIVEPGIGYKPLESNFLTQTGIPIVLPMYSEQNEVLGFIVIGPKKSGIRYSIEDIELLLTVTLNLGLTIERNELHKSLVVEQMEAERLAEINKLKSYFVSSVSHDLKTPLTSIRMFAEILRNSKECKRRDTREALEIIEGESERLARLIENVLDFSKVERGIKDYQFKKTELNVIIRKVIRSMKYQFKMGEFIVKTQLLKKRLSLVADSDAIAEALINLLSNAMKYCGRKRKIEISTTLMRNFAVLSVRDFGIGIPNDKLEKIFEPFYRHKDERQLQSGGAGLGLSLVKHIVESHKGRIEVISKVNSGSTFKLYFPLR
jgi:signal transduction histidine kinase